MSLAKENERNENKKRHSLVTGLRVITLFMVLIMAVSFFFAVLYLVRQERIKNITNEAERTITTLEDGVHAELTRYRELSRLIMTDKGVVEYLHAGIGQIDGGFIKNTRYSILDILNVTTLVDSVFVFRNDGRYVNSSHDNYILDDARMSEDEWLEEILKRRGASVISINCNGAITRSNGVPIVSIGRVINDVTSQEKIGILFMSISPVFIDRKLEVLGGTNMVVMSEDGIVLSGDENLKKFLPASGYSDDITHAMVRDGVSKVMISYSRVPDTPLIVACATPVGNGFVMFETVRVIMILLMIFAIMIIVASVFIAKNVTSPISVLTREMEHNKETGRLDAIDADIANNEIGMLKDSYNGMVERVNDLFAQNLENEKSLRRAELRVLHEQIKPHFLYNSLETIGYLAMESGADNVHTALETLGSFYRNFLSKGDRVIPLEREINIVKDYLSLQKLRYGDIIEDEYMIGEGTGQCMIPKLILQPLVENSIYHGIRLTGEKGTILIKTELTGGDLHIFVRDTGVGMSEEQIEYLLSDHEGESLENLGETSESFGLWGTIERVRLFCGKKDVVKISSELGEYTEIEFIIPTESKSRYSR